MCVRMQMQRQTSFTTQHNTTQYKIQFNTQITKYQVQSINHKIQCNTLHFITSHYVTKHHIALRYVILHPIYTCIACTLHLHYISIAMHCIARRCTTPTFALTLPLPLHDVRILHTHTLHYILHNDIHPCTDALHTVQHVTYTYVKYIRA